MSSAPRADDWLEVELGPEHRVGGRWLPEIELGRSGEEDSGRGEDVSGHRIRLRISRNPVPHNLRKLSRLSLTELPPELRVILESHEPWLLPHVVQVMNEGKIGEVLQLGYAMRFTYPQKVSVQGLFPNTEFLTVAGAHAAIDVSASVGLSGALSGAVPLGSDSGTLIPLNGGVRFNATTRGGIVGSLSVEIKTSVVVATGIGDSRSEWIFYRRDKPLIGDLSMVQTVLVPKNAPKLEFEATAFAVISPFPFVRERLEVKPWIPFKCVLPKQDSAQD